MKNEERIYLKAQEKSVGNKKQVAYNKTKKQVYKNGTKKAFNTGIILGAAFAVGITIGTTSYLDKANDNQIVKEELKSYNQVVWDNTNRTQDSDNYYYEFDDIADYISKDSNLEKAIYGVYRSMGYNRNTNMNMVIEKLGLDGIHTFKDYVISLGYTDEAGNADYDKYEEGMKELVLLQNEVNEDNSMIEEYKGVSK